jgi:hypothetical protein
MARRVRTSESEPVRASLSAATVGAAVAVEEGSEVVDAVAVVVEVVVEVPTVMVPVCSTTWFDGNVESITVTKKVPSAGSIVVDEDAVTVMVAVSPSTFDPPQLHPGVSDPIKQLRDPAPLWEEVMSEKKKSPVAPPCGVTSRSNVSVSVPVLVKSTVMVVDSPGARFASPIVSVVSAGTKAPAGTANSRPASRRAAPTPARDAVRW